MARNGPSSDDILNAIRKITAERGATPSRAQFIAASGITEYHVLKFFPAWNEAVRAAGCEPDLRNVKLSDDDLLIDWGAVVRANRSIPTRSTYRREGRYSVGVFDTHFGPWATMPERFRGFAAGKPEWADVVAFLPVPPPPRGSSLPPEGDGSEPAPALAVDMGGRARHAKLQDRPTYGDPIDFRGLRHAPVNEQGVVLLFGMVAHELGYLVEVVQTGFPDCEAKRQVASGQWQRVRIEFEYESRNFRDHGHDPQQCDVIVCWRDNWAECPEDLEVVELATVIRTLASDDG